jgi:hypothetical protein
MCELKNLHSDNSRLLKWAYTRIWNLREEERSITTSEIIAAMSGYFRLNLSPYQLENLKKRIDRVRNTVNKKFVRHERSRQKLAEAWRSDIRLIKRWENAGILNLSDHHSMEKLTELLIERDYVSIVHPEEIPTDPTIKIWDKF